MVSYREMEARRAAKRGWVGALIGAAVLMLSVWGVWLAATRAEVRRPSLVGRTYQPPLPTPEQTRRWERDKARPPMPQRGPVSFHLVKVEEVGLAYQNAVATWVVTADVSRAREVAEEVALVGGRAGYDRVTVFVYWPGMEVAQEAAAQSYT